ncbi:MAG: ISKra4 family transposase [Nitrospirae bacterium]|nr:ISKra4 family transposase [Nitrospirota bacterium]MCL5285855.1 ISKra4 family transposase [Nitrospirota bacterium]
MGARILERPLNQVGENASLALPCPSCGKEVRYAGTRSKEFLSVLGPITLVRRYCLCSSCHQGFFPKDRMLDVEGASVTPGVLRMTGIVGAELSFEKGSEFLWELAGLDVSPKQVERVAEALGAEIACNERTCLEPDPVTSLPSTLYLGPDGTGIPMRREEVSGRSGKQEDGSAKTREVKLCVVWSAETTDDQGIPVRDEGSASYTAAIESAASPDTGQGPSDFAARVLREASRRRFDHVVRQVVVADGAPWIWNLASEHFPRAIQILDLFHAKEHLGDVAKAIFGPDSEKTLPWIKDRHAELDDGKIDAIIAALRIYAPRCEEARKCIGYLETNRHRMNYPEFRAQGLCVSSGMVEAGCKTAIGARLKQSGMFWSLEGANAIIALRCAKLSGRLEPFFERRAARRCA